MLYLKSMTLHKFKSFKHAELLFSKGFTCVVGPNGSGKSNICDALLFGLGEGSLRRLRARTLDTLISSSQSKSKELRTAYVKIELGGDENYSVTRAVRSDGKSLYRVNGKRMSRQEVLELTNKYGIRADETNTITQGEINRLIELSPKGRRELIDIASGIDEFERKKEEALKELEKVSQKVSEAHIMLDERMGFLKELESEKEGAEKYLQMSSRLKSLNYSILISKKTESERALSEYTKEMAITDSKKLESSGKLEAVAKKVEQLNTERQQLTRDLGESAKAMGSINAKLEAVKMELARLEMSTSNNHNLISENEKIIEGLESEEANAKEMVSKNNADVAELSKRIASAEEHVGKSKAKGRDAPQDFGDVNKLTEALQESEKKAQELNDQLAALQAELSATRSGNESTFKNMKILDVSEVELDSRREHLSKRANVVNSQASNFQSRMKQLNSEITYLTRNISSMDEETIRLREQRASSQPRSNIIYNKIKDTFGDVAGFYGKAADLCSYPDGYANAIEAAAGARFDYIVVDSLDTANSIIKYLKENSMGRATFIPIKELMSSDVAKEKDARAVVDLLEFSPRFKNVFNFVFSNTYMVEYLNQAKKIGIGKHRYVTVEGEVIEQSGVISGGSAQRRVSTSGIEKQIKELSQGLESARKELSEKNEEVARALKENAYADGERQSMEKQIEELESEKRKLAERKSFMDKDLKKGKEGESRLEREASETEKERKKVLENLETAKTRLSEAYSKSVEYSKNLTKYGLSKEEIEKAEAIRKELEDLKIKKAELQKESSMLEQRGQSIRKQISEKSKSIEEAKKIVAIEVRKTSELQKQKTETEAKITSDNDTSKKIYGKISNIEAELAKTAGEQNRLSSELSTIDRQMSELKIRRSQVETRINDLGAELSVYKEEMKPLKEDPSSMEKEVIILNAKINELGNVNLKAPEMFEERKKTADEAMSKVDTLENERQAVLRMIEEIDSKKLQTFMSTLNDIAKNFSKLYNYIFTGSAGIQLENPKDPFNSGLEILVMNGKARKILTTMSGGEKSLLSLILIFAIHMCKPSSLYVFDEVDAALDKENSKKLSQLIKQMSSNAQFIVVSHNDSLIVNADTAVGVTKANDESRAVGVEVSSILNRKQ